MKTPRVYLDTSVIGGCCDAEFARWSLALLRDIRLGLLVPVISTLTEDELVEAPDEVQDVHEEIVAAGCERIMVTPEPIALAAKYLAEGILTDRYEDDATHIALATVAQVDILVSWNYKHIVRYDKIRQYNAVNVLMGYAPIQIHTPREVASGEV